MIVSSADVEVQQGAVQQSPRLIIAVLAPLRKGTDVTSQ
jgi:hypothetical protein